MKHSFSAKLWGEGAKLKWLMITAIILGFGFLGSRLLWTMENRWADIVQNMLYSGDYLHPYMLNKTYYDKPLMSYWLIVAFIKLTGVFNAFILRLPSALAGLFTVLGTYALGKSLSNKSFALKSGWLLLTAIGMIFWSRVASSDMLNVMSIVLAVLCYQRCKHNEKRFAGYVLFFLLIAFGCLCKGVVAFACVGLVILPDFIKQKGWRMHLNFRFLLAAIIGVLVYFVPFYLSSHYNAVHYQKTGLLDVYRENFLRFVHPWDHKGPVYTYLIFLPLYLFPWILFFIPAVLSQLKSWKSLAWEAKWMLLATVLLFIFFTASQSRRSYYILPVIPFAVLVTANWLTTECRQKLAAWCVAAVLAIAGLFYLILVPLLGGDSEAQFGREVKAAAMKIQPWQQWHVVVLGARMRDIFYVYPANKPTTFDMTRTMKHEKMSQQMLVKNWPMLNDLQPNTIYITTKQVAGYVSPLFKGYQVIVSPEQRINVWLNKVDPNEPVAFIPSKKV